MKEEAQREEEQGQHPIARSRSEERKHQLRKAISNRYPARENDEGEDRRSRLDERAKEWEKQDSTRSTSPLRNGHEYCTTQACKNEIVNRRGGKNSNIGLSVVTHN